MVDESFIAVGRDDSIGEGELVGTYAGEVPVLLVRFEGRIHALGRMCTHQNVDLADGYIERGCVVCPLHGSKFDIVTGIALTLPAIDPEPVYEVQIDSGAIYVATAKTCASPEGSQHVANR